MCCCSVLQCVTVCCSVLQQHVVLNPELPPHVGIVSRAN